MDINKLAEIVYEWAQATFPDRTIGSMALKLYEEIGEMLRSPKDHLEFADVMILLLDHAVIHGIDVRAAIIEKLKINMKREWAVNEFGVMSHAKDS